MNMSDFIDIRHLLRMTDSTGLFQHAVGGIPDLSEGYTADDNARALIVAAMLYKDTGESQYEDLMVCYLSFLQYAQKNGWFRNFMAYDRRFLEKKGSEDSFGRCICALGYLVSLDSLPDYIRKPAVLLLENTFESCSKLTFLKGKAYTLAGLTFWDNPSARDSVRKLASSIDSAFYENRKSDWNWYEDVVTYCSGILPFALFRAGRYDRKFTETALASLKFLSDIVFKNGYFKPIGCKGWYKCGKKPAAYDEQPVEACSMLTACSEAFVITGQQRWKDYAKLCYEWYLGKNSLKVSLIDSDTGGCLDGIGKDGPNINQGAESIVCWIIAELCNRTE